MATRTYGASSITYDMISADNQYSITERPASDRCRSDARTFLFGKWYGSVDWFSSRLTIDVSINAFDDDVRVFRFFLTN